MPNSRKRKISPKAVSQPKPKRARSAKKANGSVLKDLSLQTKPSEIDLADRVRWRKERRDYWRNRFHRLISSIRSRSSKAKKR